MSVLFKLVLVYAILASREYFFVRSSSTKRLTSRVCETYIKPGNFMIGGIISPYGSENAPCGGEILWYRVSYVETMAYAVDMINK